MEKLVLFVGLAASFLGHLQQAQAQIFAAYRSSVRWCFQISRPTGRARQRDVNGT